MSLKTDYYEGLTGLLAQLDAAFQVGVAWVGTGTSDVSELSLGDRDGSNLAAGSTNPGLYFDCGSPGIGYRVWVLVSGEVAPASGGRVLVQFNVQAMDNGSTVAANLVTLLNGLPGTPFTATSLGSSVRIENTQPGVVNPIISVGTLGGTANVNQVQAGVQPTGNYVTIKGALISNAQQGLTKFTLTIPGTGTLSPTYLRANHGANLLNASFLAGIGYALAGQQIYNYECKPILDLSDQVNTSVDLNFNFQPTLVASDLATADVPNCKPCTGQSNGYSSIY